MWRSLAMINIFFLPEESGNDEHIYIFYIILFSKGNRVFNNFQGIMDLFQRFLIFVIEM